MSLSNAAAAGHCPFAALAALAFREEEGGGADRPDQQTGLITGNVVQAGLP